MTLIGNLGNEPEIRTTTGGSTVATFSLATSRSWNSPSGEKQEKTEWHRCVAWNGKGTGMGLADIVEKYCRKGERVFVEGSIEYGQYKDKEGQTRYTTEIKVRELMLLGSGGRGVILMELEDKESLVSAQAISQRGVRVHGIGRGGKPQEVNLSATGLGIHIGKRARKGKALEAKIKATGLQKIMAKE